MDSNDIIEAEKLRAEEKRVVRKVDWLLMPILTITLGLQYYDKAVLGNAAVFGIIKDLDLSTTVNGVTSTKRYSTATAAFYWGYIVAVLPFAVLLARLPLAKTAAVLVLVWGVICILTTVCSNYSGFIAQRFFLGLAESAVSPAFVAVTALWYKPYEQATRMGIWYSATGIFSMISGLINYGIGHNHLAHKWKGMYYFCGSVTIAWSFVIWFFLPGSPLQPGRFFNEREREVLRRRLEENPFGKDRMPLKFDQFIEAVMDIKTYIYFLMGTAIYICNGSVTAFGARIISGFGYDSLTTTALLIPGGAVTVLTIAIFSTIADKYKDSRTYVLPVSCIPVVVGALVIWLAPWHPTAGPLIGYYLVASFGAPYVLLLTIAAGNVTGATKKAVTSGAIFIGYNVGNIASAYLVFTQEKAVKYRSTWISVIVGMVVASALSLLLRFIFIRENARRDALAAHGSTSTSAGHAEGAEKSALGSSDTHLPHVEKLEAYEDKTDKQRSEFRYSL
ncbi:major facilitator superfamily domain-containing protein [Naematelia encephala]|uniref:Major facilitator superfamily domain-containing protein n=1 Tax=Naematelia encephala TaxID=71784 RepID=A0A1Y2AYC6_9TREE|nr:major facilitator superfamily domain-containing protein [Naematelia encephala]